MFLKSSNDYITPPVARINWINIRFYEAEKKYEIIVNIKYTNVELGCYSTEENAIAVKNMVDNLLEKGTGIFRLPNEEELIKIP